MVRYRLSSNPVIDVQIAVHQSQVKCLLRAPMAHLLLSFEQKAKRNPDPAFKSQETTTLILVHQLYMCTKGEHVRNY